MTNSIAEIAGADVILALGTNTTETHPIISLKVREALAKGATLIVVDPRQTEMAQMAHLHLSPKPGTDLALLNGLAWVIIEEGLWNRRFVEERTEGFAELKESLSRYRASYVEEITGIPEHTLREVARLYAKGPNSSILYTMGITQRIVGTDNVLAIANLAMLTGQVGKPYSGVNPLRGQNNVQGACDMGGLPDVYPGYQKVTVPEIRSKFEREWEVKLDDQVGLTVGEMMDAAGEGRIKGMYIVGENPVLSDPDANKVVRALERLEFLVVQDIFLTETARMAHVVLPAASFAEKEGTFTNTERRVQKIRQAIQPIAESKPDWQIVAELATAMGSHALSVPRG